MALKFSGLSNRNARTEAHFALQTGVECRAAEEELILVWLRWRTHEGCEGEVVLSLPMGLEKKKAKEFAVHAGGGVSCDGRQERDTVIVSI